MRLGVLDIGSNTGHLLVVDAHDGAAPLPAYSYKEPLRLAEHLDEQGAINAEGLDALAEFTGQAQQIAEEFRGAQRAAHRAVADEIRARRHARPD